MKLAEAERAVGTLPAKRDILSRPGRNVHVPVVPFAIVLRRVVRDPYKVKDRVVCLVVYARSRREALEKAEYHHMKWIEMHKGIAGVVRLPSSGKM